MSRRVAVTGATGFIGRHVVRVLAARGDRVAAVVRPDSPGLRAGPMPDGVEVVTARLTAEDLPRALAGADAVVHLAGVISTRLTANYASTNVDATRAVAEASRASGAHLVYVSSLAAAGPAPASAPRAENDPDRPITTYGMTKLGGERAIEAVNGLAWTMLRPGVVYGEGDHALTPLFGIARMPVMPVVGGADTAYTFVFIDDLVRAIVAAIDRKVDRLICFVGHPNPVTAHGLVRAVRAAAGSRALLVPVPRPLVWIAANACELAGALVGKELLLSRRRYAEMYAPGFVCSLDRLRDTLGVVAEVDLGEGLKRSAEWYLRDSVTS
jgi:nucleoside-diphosphate-sugar epimerase